VSFSESGSIGNSSGSDVTSLSSQLPDTPNSMVPSPVETWERLVCSPANHENSSYHGHGKDSHSAIRPIATTCYKNRGTLFPKIRQQIRWPRSEMMESETLHSRPTLKEWTMFNRNGYSLFVLMTASLGLSVVFGHFFFVFFEKYLFKRLSFRS